MTESLFGLKGKGVLVIGGGQGMGESASRLLASAGCDIAVLDLDLNRAEEVAAEVRSLGVRGVALAADVTDDDDLRGAIARADEELDGLYGMVCIVGMASWAPLLEMDSAVWDRDQARNIRYFFIAAQEFARRMIGIDRPGSIVGIASVDGLQSAPFHAAYGAAKAGLVNLVRSMAAEWTQHGIRVNAVAPGSIVTPRVQPGSAEEERERFRALPAKRRGTTDDIGKAVLFLTSDLASYVTGQTLAVDGGYTAVGPMDYSGVVARAGGVGATIGMK